MPRSIEKTVTIAASPDVVWRALIEAEELKRWFPIDARVQPGPGGSIWLSWGGGIEGEAPITAWEPGRHLQWTESRGPVKIVIDFFIESAGDGTVVRLVQSGFGDGKEWDDEFHMTDGGWSYFVEHLRWYLERHPGIPRDVVTFRQPVPLTRMAAFERLIGSSGLSLSPLGAGTPFATTTAIGDRISGTIVTHKPATGHLGLTIAELNDAILLVEIEPGASGSTPALWLSTYGLDPGRLEQARGQFGKLYRRALGLEASV